MTSPNLKCFYKTQPYPIGSILLFNLSKEGDDEEQRALSQQAPTFWLHFEQFPHQKNTPNIFETFDYIKPLSILFSQHVWMNSSGANLIRLHYDVIAN